ncbi:MAG: FAD-dependent oxidoreductase [Candidatus Saccharibacteria bacterium]
MHKYIVTANEKLTATTQLLTLQASQPAEAFDHEPGQYATISFKRKYRPTPARCFSIVTAPEETGKLQFCMRNRGRFTRAVTDLKPGDPVAVRGPFGGFIIEPSHAAKIVLLAGGIGITPFMSMIRHAAFTQSTTDITLIYSCPNQQDMPFFEELIKLERTNPHFSVVFSISAGPIDRLNQERIYSGRIGAELLEAVIAGTFNDRTFFICGPPGFMKGLSAMLADKAVDDRQIVTEAFSQGPNRQTGEMRDWPFNMYALAAVGVVLGSFIIMLSDLLKTLPPILKSNSAQAAAAAQVNNNRQANLDALVNNLPPNPSSSSTITPNPPTTTAAAATPAPVCTTSQSGVTTCR